MKKYFFATVALFMVASVGVFAQNSEAPKPVAALWLNEERHDFGKIPVGTPVYTQFELKGVGKELKLEMVQAGCGCTTPEFKAGTYKEGEVVKIKVGFNAAAVGPFTKPITIYYNDGEEKTIYIAGEVLNTPAAPAPGNGLLSKIKL